VTSGFRKLADAAAGVLFTGGALFLAGVVEAAPPAPADRTAARAELEHAPRVASYLLEARLDENTHRVAGKGVIEFSNASRAPLGELYFHLYMNAFKHEKSLFLRSPFGAGRSDARAEDWGFIDVKSLKARELEGVDLWPTRENGSPAEPNDETDVKVTLPRPLAPGERLTLDVEFSCKLPRIVLRTGYSGDFHFVGQWFPKLARLTPEGAFVHFPFHPQAEFYADYGSYDVTIDVPATMTVGATGERVETRTGGGRRRERYRAVAVHDFAWTAWPGFLEQHRTIDGVAVRMLYPEGHQRNASDALDALAFALPHASRQYGPYPYPTLTVVHPPAGADQAGGMEYPTLITTGGPWYAGIAGDRAIEAVTVHELLHQWFYGLVGNDEARFPFLDEGLTSYAEQRSRDVAYGAGSLYRGFGAELSATAVARAIAAERGEDAPLASAASQFPGFQTLAALVYSRSATLFETLARVHGRERLDRALGAYARKYRFAHPGPAELVAALDAELGPGTAQLLDLALNQRGRVNYVVRDVQTAPERIPGGHLDASGNTDEPVEGSTVPRRFHSRALVVRHGELELPVEILLIDSTGKVTKKHWNGAGPFHVVEHHGDAPLATVVVDPERRVLLDDDLLDNAATVSRSLPLRTLERGAYAGLLALAVLGP